jgi:gamma-glutamylcyclotransferase (GGCT)/AIG2-like uncharacterized protein YtfP
MLIRVFVYGTLKPGECNYRRYCDGKIVNAEAAIAQGQLFHLSRRGYPAMTAGVGTVHGFVLSFADPTLLQILDKLEDYHPDRPREANEYHRQQIEAFNVAGESIGLVWVYLMEPQQIKLRGGEFLPEGVWSSRL